MTQASSSSRLPLPALRQALQEPRFCHAEPTKVGDGVTAFQRVRLSADKSEAVRHSATSGRHTSALAAVPSRDRVRTLAPGGFAAWDGPFEVDPVARYGAARQRQVFPCRETNADEGTLTMDAAGHDPGRHR